MIDKTQPVVEEIEKLKQSIQDKQKHKALLDQGIAYDKGKLKLAEKYLSTLTKDADPKKEN
jgi:hypothetical protein